MSDVVKKKNSKDLSQMKLDFSADMSLTNVTSINVNTYIYMHIYVMCMYLYVYIKLNISQKEWHFTICSNMDGPEGIK